jgi:hypothetical protein
LSSGSTPSNGQPKAVAAVALTPTCPRTVARVLPLVGPKRLTLHFHNTRGCGLANVLAAYEAAPSAR